MADIAIHLQSCICAAIVVLYIYVTGCEKRWLSHTIVAKYLEILNFNDLKYCILGREKVLVCNSP